MSMIRLIAVFGLVTLPHLGHAGDPADPDDESPCRGRHKRVELVLTADEFRIPAYDARRGLVLVRPETDLLPGVERAFSVRLRMASPEVLMPLGPTGLFFGLESGTHELEMVVEAEPFGPECDAEARPACDELKVRAVHLKRGEMVISSRRLDEPIGPVTRFETRVFGRMNIERGEVDAAALDARAREIGEACLRRALARTRMIQGALSVQLGADVVGQLEPPTVVVDGLVDPELTRCLLDRFGRDAAVAELLPPAARAYLTLYFRGEAVVSTPDPVSAELAIERNQP